MVSFGAAPALVMYEWVLRDMGKLGWIAAFVYCAGAALRLARFNTMLDVADKRWFTGIPSPAAAALVAGCVWIVDDYSIEPETIRWWAWFVTVFAGLTMVSNLKYYSFKSINLRKSVPFFAVLLFVVALGAAGLPASARAVRRVRGLRDLRLRGFGMAARAPRTHRERELSPGGAAPPRIAVLVPCYNEALTVAKVIADFSAALPGAVVYVYDNRSSDGTGDVARAAGAVVRREERPGKGGVMRRMFAEIDADIYIVTDGDATYDATRAPEMVAAPRARRPRRGHRDPRPRGPRRRVPPRPPVGATGCSTACSGSCSASARRTCSPAIA